MEKITFTEDTDGTVHPVLAGHEDLAEAAEHSLTGDPVSTSLPDPGAYARFFAWRCRELGLR